MWCQNFYFFIQVIYRFLLLYAQYIELLQVFVLLFRHLALLYSLALKLDFTYFWRFFLMVMPVFCTENRFFIWRVSFDSWWSFARVIWDTQEGLSVKVFSMAVLGLSRLKCLLFKEGLNREKCYIDRWINGLMCFWCKISRHRLVNFQKPQKQRVCLDAQMIVFHIHMIES